MAVGIICGVKTMGLLFCFYTAVQLRADCGRSRHRLRTACRCTTAVFFHHGIKNFQKSFAIQNNSVTLSSVIIAIIVCETFLEL